VVLSAQRCVKGHDHFCELRYVRPWQVRHAWCDDATGQYKCARRAPHEGQIHHHRSPPSGVSVGIISTDCDATRIHGLMSDDRQYTVRRTVRRVSVFPQPHFPIGIVLGGCIAKTDTGSNYRFHHRTHQTRRFGRQGAGFLQPFVAPVGNFLNQIHP